MKIIKFGGTAFQTPKLLENVCQIIINEEKPLLVVASAIGRRGFPFSTDTLIDSIKENYLSPKEFDRLLGLGETYATLFLSNALLKNHVKAYALSYLENGIGCDENYGEGLILSLNDEKYQRLINEYDVLVTPGFIASTNDKELITLGRGTSDLSAVELAKLFKEKSVILYKDVNGVYPFYSSNILRFAPYEYLSYDEVLALIEIGISPVNKKAILEAKKDEIEIVIRNFIANSFSTIISSKGSERKIIGINFENNVVLIATFYGEKVKEELEKLFKKQHIYIKDEVINYTNFSFKVNGSQVLLVRQIIISNYFKDMIRS